MDTQSLRKEFEVLDRIRFSEWGETEEVRTKIASILDELDQR